MQEQYRRDHHSIQQQLERTLPQINKVPRYPYRFIAIMTFSWFIASFSNMIGSYVFMNPLFQCHGEPKTQVQACANYDGCVITNNFSAVEYAGLYCDGEIMRNNIQSAFFFGCIVGVIVLMPLSGSWGRKPTLLFITANQVVGAGLIILGVYYKIWILSIIGQFMSGIFMSPATYITYVATGQVVNDKLHQKSFMLYNAIWGFSQMLFLPIYYWFPQWNIYMIYVMLIPSVILLLLIIFFVYETPHFYLFMCKDIAKFNKVIDELAVLNESDKEVIDNVKQLAQEYIETATRQQQKTITLKQSLRKIATSRKLVLYCLAFASCEAAFNVYYDGVQGSMERTGYNFGVSMILLGVHEFVGYLLVSLISHKIPRKIGLVLSVLVCSATGLVFIIPFVATSDIFQSILVSVGRVSTVFSYSMLSFFENQSFPTEIKSTAYGVFSGLGQLSKLAVPYLISAMNNIGVHPIIISSIIFIIFSTFPIICVKETLNRYYKSQLVVSHYKQAKKISQKSEGGQLSRNLITSQEYSKIKN